MGSNPGCMYLRLVIRMQATAHRDATRLDGSRGKKEVWRRHVRT